ncbi:MAG TPA: isochorismatase family protein [Acidimicrobiales bacterium]|nr:isochorismatase family protein [Acidimicrobiales bacterium]
MSENPNLITIDNSVLILIDHQPWVAFSVQSIDRSLLVNNVTGLAVAAKALRVPTVLTTVGAHGGPLSDPIFAQISEVFPDQTPIDRISTNAWSDIKPAVEDTGRQVLIMAGIWTEVCVAQTTLSALRGGYTVYFVSDCSGGVTQEAHEDGKQRMVQAGANGINWIGLVAEWTPDHTTPERAAVNPGLVERGSGVGLSLEYLRANRSVPAGRP